MGYSAFLKEQKSERFLTLQATDGLSASTQNQAFNAVPLFYRDVPKQEPRPIKSLRARQRGNPRH